MGSYNEYEEKQSRLRGEKERAKGLHLDGWSGWQGSDTGAESKWVQWGM